MGRGTQLELEQRLALEARAGGNKFVANAKLTAEQVVHIKKCLLEGFLPVEIAHVYGVGKETIARIKRGETWAHIRVEGEEVMQRPNRLEAQQRESAKMPPELALDAGRIEEAKQRTLRELGHLVVQVTPQATPPIPPMEELA